MTGSALRDDFTVGITHGTACTTVGCGMWSGPSQCGQNADGCSHVSLHSQRITYRTSNPTISCVITNSQGGSFAMGVPFQSAYAADQANSGIEAPVGFTDTGGWVSVSCSVTEDGHGADGGGTKNPWG